MLRLALVTLILVGCEGERGPAGVLGPRGPAGAPGKDATVGYRPKSWFYCTATLDLISNASGAPQRATDGIAETLLDYSVLIYANRDVEADCSADINAEFGSSGRYFPSISRGAQTAGCIAPADYPPVGRELGSWSFEMSSNRPQAVYMDLDNPLGLDGFVYVFADADCSSDVLGDDGKWTPITLADVF